MVDVNQTSTSGDGARARVGIVDDHPSVILGIGSILNAQEGMLVAAWGATVDELLAQSDRFDIVLLDLVLADASTPTRNIRALGVTGAPVVAYTGGDQPSLVREAARAGAIGMVRKSEQPATIVEAVRAALRGEVVASTDWAAALDFDTEFVTARLSDREAEVLSLYASGETAAQVAARLFISRQTVLDHIRRIRAKYAAVGRPAHTKLDLYRRAVEDGIVSTES